MKRSIYHILGTLCATVALILASCNADEPQHRIKEGTVFYPALHIGVSTMEMSADTRASMPMSPDDEKYVKTIALFEFDGEGIHDKGENTYHFIDFLEGTIDNKLCMDTTEFGIVETTLENISLAALDSGTICLVANVTRADVDTLYKKYHDQGQSATRLTLTNFKKWSLKFTYLEPENPTVYDESVTGHLKDMYMFGYYEGRIDPATSKSISVDLGRLASRLDITITNQTGKPLDRRFGYHFDNVCEYAYFFPILMSMPPTIQAGLARTVICAGNEPVEGDDYTKVPQTFPDGGVHTRYYYVAAHSADSIQSATMIHLFYGSRIVDDNQMAPDATHVQVPLCNVHPDHAAEVKNGYSLSRNTRYHFTINLKSRAAAPAAKLRTTPPNTMITDYGRSPGEINIYLPD